MQQPDHLPQQPTAVELERECHALIRQIGRKPINIKLLLGILPTLRQFAAYKSGRLQRFHSKD